MSQPRPESRSDLSRPLLIDYLMMLVGMALTLYFLRLAPLDAVAHQPLAPPLAHVFAFLAVVARLPEGIVLLWPAFFLTQMLSRTEGLTAAEWLWLLSSVGVLLLTALMAWEHLLGLPESWQPHAAKPRILWYLLVAPSLAGLGLLVLVVDLFRSRTPPWTHHFGLALVLWPAPSSLLVLLGGEFVGG